MFRTARAAATRRCVWLAASALLHALPLALRAEIPSAQRRAVAPVELELVQEPAPRAASVQRISEPQGVAAVAPQRPARREAAVRRAQPIEPQRDSSEPAPTQPAAELPLAREAPAASAAPSPPPTTSAQRGDALDGLAGALPASAQRTMGADAAALGFGGARPASPGTDPDVLRQRYLRELRQRVLAQREYPRAAQRAGLQGVICLRLSLTASGYVSELRATCGPLPEVLLEAAQRAVRAAEPFRALPSAFGSQLTVDLPVVFQLDAP
jgi:TonB family protein